MQLDKIKVITEIAKLDIGKTEFAQKAGINRGTLTRVIKGKNCSKQTAVKISNTLDIPLENLL